MTKRYPPLFQATSVGQDRLLWWGFAVWKNWNENGEYVVYTVPPDTTMKVWEGPAASQVRSVTDNGKKVDVVLEGGGTQIVIDPADLNLDYLSKRQPTKWEYRDFSNEVDMYIGVPKLETNLYQPKPKDE